MWAVEHERAEVSVLLCHRMNCLLLCAVDALCSVCSDGGSSETHVEEYCSFVVDNFVNQQYWNRLSDVAGVESRRYMCEIEIASSPSPTPTATSSVSGTATPTYTVSPTTTASQTVTASLSCTATSSRTTTATVSGTPSFGTSLTPTPSPSVTASLSSMCLPGWSRYMNDGSELSDSCLQVSGSMFGSWTAASVGCPAGSHMLTVRSSLKTNGLTQFVAVSICTGKCYAGASQSSTAVYRNRGWAWVDGTDASSLNCGAPDTIGCGLWLGAEPKYVCLESFASVRTAVIERVTFIQLLLRPAVMLVPLSSILKIMQSLTGLFQKPLTTVATVAAQCRQCVRLKCRRAARTAGPTTLMLTAQKAPTHACTSRHQLHHHGVLRTRAVLSAHTC